MWVGLKIILVSYLTVCSGTSGTVDIELGPQTISDNPRQ